MKDEGFPRMHLGPGPEPRLSSDFASRVIDKARAIRARRRRRKIGIGASAGFAALIAMFLWMRPPTANQPALSDASGTGMDTVTWTDEADTDMLTVLMPSARQAQKFDAYYGTAAWDTYASWNPDSYDSSRTR